MGLIFSNDNDYLECPECKSRNIAERDMYAYKRKNDKEYIKEYRQTEIYCAHCGEQLACVNKNNVSEEPQHTNT